MRLLRLRSFGERVLDGLGDQTRQNFVNRSGRGHRAVALQSDASSIETCAELRHFLRERLGKASLHERADAGGRWDVDDLQLLAESRA